MPNENLQPKPSAIDRIDSIIQKMELQQQVEAWQIIGDKIHQRLDANRRHLDELERGLRKEGK